MDLTEILYIGGFRANINGTTHAADIPSPISRVLLQPSLAYTHVCMDAVHAFVCIPFAYSTKIDHLLGVPRRINHATRIMCPNQVGIVPGTRERPSGRARRMR